MPLATAYPQRNGLRSRRRQCSRRWWKQCGRISGGCPSGIFPARHCSIPIRQRGQIRLGSPGTGNLCCCPQQRSVRTMPAGHGRPAGSWTRRCQWMAGSTRCTGARSGKQTKRASPWCVGASGFASENSRHIEPAHCEVRSLMGGRVTGGPVRSCVAMPTHAIGVQRACDRRRQHPL